MGAYCILRSVPFKLGGVLAMFCSLLVLALVPVLPSSNAIALTYYPPAKLLFWFLVTCFILLTLGGSWPVAAPFSAVCSFFSFFYFLLFLLIPLSKLLWDHVIWG